MNNQKGISPIIIVLILAVIVGVGTVYLYQQSKVAPQPEIIQPSQPTPASLSAPKVTVYTDGFVKVEIEVASNNNTGYLDRFIKSVFAVENEIITYEVYRSIEIKKDFVKIATEATGIGTKYLAVFDANYPKTAKILQYKYKRISGSGDITESKISEAEILRAVAGGHQPWRAQPLWVAQAEGAGIYGFRMSCAGWGEAGGQPRENCDVYNLLGENGEVIEAGVTGGETAKVRVIHDGQSFIIELRQPVPDMETFWWTVSKIMEEIG